MNRPLETGQLLPRFVLLFAFALQSFPALSKPPQERPSQVPYNIILITPDMLRADFLHTYGYPYPDSPHIDQFAKEGTVFLHAYSAGSWTTPSFTTILTGLFPTVHGMTLLVPQACGPDITKPLSQGKVPPTLPSYIDLSPFKPTVAQLLAKAGMTTVADNSNCWSIWDNVNRGWDTVHYEDSFATVPGHSPLSQVHLTAPETTKWAQHWLAEHRNGRFFLWVHYMEPHGPYNPPAAYDRFSTPDDFPDVKVADNYPTPDVYLPQWKALYDQSIQFFTFCRLGDASAIRRLKELYAAKILYMDHYVSELLSTIRQMGLEKNTIVIFVSDHGQLLFSHPKDYNTDDHRSVYNTDQHVPLIFWGAGIPAHQRLQTLAGQYDIMPTILALEHLPAAPVTDGKSLLPAIEGRVQQVHHFVYGEETAVRPQYSVRGLRYKLIEDMRTGRAQCFDLMIDPREQHNICAQIPKEASELQAALNNHIELMINQARHYPDWKDNLALAVLDGRDSRSLEAITPRDKIVSPATSGITAFQLDGRRIWKPIHYGIGGFWANPGSGSAYIIWRTDQPLIGTYRIGVRYANPGAVEGKLATNATFRVTFGAMTRSFTVDENQHQNEWNWLGYFHDPISVKLTNRADGPVIVGSVRFLRVEHGQDMP
ncbi:MAG: sulfatase-like hydrolase/transferase [Acidobacteria bacterium]|nr:sulfatase-like hydrolase/transferase [Acidobacteriota bacterium]